MALDLSNEQPATGRQLLPNGEYPIWLTESSAGTMKDGTGLRTRCTFEVIEGQFKGRKIFENFNLINVKSPDNQRISRELARSLVDATGVPPNNVPEDFAPCRLKPMIAVVRVSPARGEYEASNKIDKFKPFTGSAAGFVAPQAPGVASWMQSPAPQQQAMTNPVHQQQAAVHQAYQQQAPQQYQPQGQYQQQPQPQQYQPAMEQAQPQPQPQQQMPQQMQPAQQMPQQQAQPAMQQPAPQAQPQPLPQAGPGAMSFPFKRN